MYTIINTTDGKYKDKKVEFQVDKPLSVSKDLEFEWEIARKSGDKITLSNSNYIIHLKKDTLLEESIINKK